MANAMKWEKHLVLSKDYILANHLPNTKLFKYENLWKLLNKYNAVILKPTTGSGGAGVIKVTSLGKNLYQIQFENKAYILSGKNRVYYYLKKLTGIRSYLIQEYIHLITVHKRPVDIRVMVQRELGFEWQVTGKLAKIAGPGYIVTNIHRSKGSIITVEDALKKNNYRYSEVIIRELEDIALLAAQRIQQGFYKRATIIGLDMAIDKQGKVWIIEANLNPQISMFLKLKDKTIFRRIYKIKQKNK